MGEGLGAGDPSHLARATRTFLVPPGLKEPDLAPPPAFAVAARGGPIGARDWGPRPARGLEQRGGRRERAHTPPPPPEPAGGARGQGGADRPSHSPGLRAGTRCRRRRVRPSPPAPGARGEKVTASWPAGRPAQGGRGRGQGDRGAERSWHPLGSWDRGGGGGQPAKDRPECQGTGRERRPRERHGDAPSFRVVSRWSRRVESGRELESKAGCGRRGRTEGRLRSFLPWEKKGRNGEWGMCRNVGPLGEAGGESGKWGGPPGRWSRHPAPSPTAAFQARAAGEVIPSGSPRAKAASCPLPRGATTLQHSNLVPPKGNVFWPKSFRDFPSPLPSRLFCSRQANRDSRSLKPLFWIGKLRLRVAKGLARGGHSCAKRGAGSRAEDLGRPCL